MEHMTSFSDLTKQVFRAHVAGKLEDALALTRSAESQYPDELLNLIYWEACLLCRIGRTDAASAELQRGINLGLWWNPSMLERDPDLTSLQGNAAFEAIKQKCNAELQTAQANATTDLVILHPTPLIENAPLVVALHQRFGHLEKTLEAWRVATDYGAVLAVPRSSQQLGITHFGWDDNERTLEDIGALWDQIKGEVAFDPDRVVLSGMSQGGNLAIHLAFAGDLIPSVGFVVVVPAIHDIARIVSIARLHPTPGNFKCWIVSGENDWGVDAAVELSEQLRQMGFHVHLEIVPDVGHEFPPDFEARLHQALTDILE